MPETTPHTALPPAVRRVLDDVRRRIRAYVWLEGIALVIAVLAAAFWVGLAIDWIFEPSPAIRQAGLVLLAVVMLYVAYRQLLRRVAVPISDSTAAVLLERRFPVLAEHVLTAVDVSSKPPREAANNPEFVHATQQSAAHAVAHVRPAELFNRRPLFRAASAAILLVLSIGVFAVAARDAFNFWLTRIALSDEPWPRRVQLEVVGFPADEEGRRVQKLAQDDDFELLVHASAEGHEVPDEVEIRFRLADGRRGRDTMIRVGEAQPGRDKQQAFRYQFKRVAGDMEFDIVGGDDRVRDLRLQVVDRPELFGLELACTYPDYLGREPRRLPVTGGMRIPEGTQLALHAKATKPLTAVRIHKTSDQQDAQLRFEDRPLNELQWKYGTLSADDVLMVSMTDIDGVSTREPYRISLTVMEDELPQVAVRLSGIGSAITPDAILPFVGKISDDYALDRVWFEYQIDGAPVQTQPIAQQPRGEPLVSNLDAFDTRASDPAGKRAIELRPGQKFAISLKAADRYNLTDEPRAGSSQQFTLEVVTAADLLALLERRELQLRQRYEAIYEKVTDTRNLLSRVDFTSPDAEDDPTATGVAPSESAMAAPQRALARRRLRVAGSLQNVLQAGDEIAGVAEGFDDLGEQLTNNRIDNPDLKSRLREQIALPLRRIGEQRMPQLAAQLRLVEQHIADPPAAEPELAASIKLADEVLVEMRQVLDRMLELETYNEVLALLRDIISDQDDITRRTRERQRERLRSLFETE